MSLHEHTKDCPVILRVLRDIQKEAREDRKEIHEKIEKVDQKVEKLGEQVVGLRVHAGKLETKTTILGMLGGGGIHAILKLLGK